MYPRLDMQIEQYSKIDSTAGDSAGVLSLLLDIVRNVIWGGRTVYDSITYSSPILDKKMDRIIEIKKR